MGGAEKGRAVARKIDELIKEAKNALNSISASELSNDEKVEAMRDVAEIFYIKAGRPDLAKRSKENRRKWKMILEGCINAEGSGQMFYSIPQELLQSWPEEE